MRRDRSTETLEPVASEPSEERRLSLVGHLDELRQRLLVCGLAFGVGFGVSCVWAGTLIEWLKRPAGWALPALAFFSPTEALVAYVKVALLSALVLAFPVILAEGWAFVRPALKSTERRYAFLAIFWGSGLFLAGCAFAYWGLLPVTLKFLLGFGREHFEPVISISRYLSFVTTILVACGIVFELPLIVWVLTKLGIISPQGLRRRRRYAILVMAIAAAFLTPTTDVATMALMIAPMVVLYEVSVLITGWASRRRR